MQLNDNVCIELAGENALILYFSAAKKSLETESNINDISPEVNAQVHQAASLIKQHLSDDIIDIIPSYASILVVYDLEKIDHYRLRNKLQTLLLHVDNANGNKSSLVELPVYYSLESGQDLQRISNHAKLTIEEVIELHQAQEYRVYAIGFAPGFAYLGEVDKRIAMPRLVTPRLKVPKGAVAIADRQTAVYPAQSPGGWNIIGLCPFDMFNPNTKKHMPVEVGDRVKFYGIDKARFLELGGKLDE